MPKVSVYITAYNYGKYLKRSIESVIDQTLSDWELIIINDGSTDDTEKILKDYEGDEKIRVINQENKGLNVSNNIALRLAKGSYIMRLDADDYLANNALHKLASYLDSNLDKDLVYPNYFEVDDQDNILSEVILRPIEELNLLDMPAHGACTMFRTKVLKMLGGYIEDYSCQDGYELWLRFIQNHTPGNVNDKLFYYRQHANSLSKNKEKILSTRRQIKTDFINRNTDGIMPMVTAIVLASTQNNIREKHPLHELSGKPLIMYTLEELQKTKNISQIVVSSESEEVLSLASKALNIIPHNRNEDGSAKFSRREDFLNSIEKFLNNKKIETEFFCILNVNSPLRTNEHIDWAINTIKIFNLDGLISVDEELSNLFRHTENGLKNFESNDGTLKIERNPIFKENGAITIFKANQNFKNSFNNDSKVGHICLLPGESIRINSSYDHWLAEKLIEKRNLTS